MDLLPVVDLSQQKSILKIINMDGFARYVASIMESVMNKKQFIEQYIVNFMATADANHLDWHSGKVINPCNYETARAEAERAFAQLPTTVTIKGPDQVINKETVRALIEEINENG